MGIDEGAGQGIGTEPSAGGDVFGPASSVVDQLAVYADATGKLLKTAPLTIDPSNNAITAVNADGNVLTIPDGDGGVGNIDALAGYNLRYNRTAVLGIDQQNISQNSTAGLTTAWQSFTTGVSGKLDKVEFQMGGLQASTIVTVSIRTGTGTGGSLLTSFAGLTLAPGWNTAIFATKPELAASTVYSIIIAKTGGPSTPDWLYQNTDVYAGGRFVISSTSDGTFKTHMLLSVDFLQQLSDGFFGFNQLAPAEMVDVGGNIKASGTLFLGGMKSGATQVAAGAAVNELWKTASHATLPDNVVLIGV